MVARCVKCQVSLVKWFVYFIDFGQGVTKCRFKNVNFSNFDFVINVSPCLISHSMEIIGEKVYMSIEHHAPYTIHAVPLIKTNTMNTLGENKVQIFNSMNAL